MIETIYKKKKYRVELDAVDEKLLEHYDRNTAKVKKRLTERELLEQLAEESAELAQASLKLIRAKGLNGNTTPVDEDKAMESFYEEVTDVLNALVALGHIPSDALYIPDAWNKMRRWAKRLGCEYES